MEKALLKFSRYVVLYTLVFSDYISVIITCLSIIIGLIVTISNMQSSWRQTRLAGLAQAKEIFSLEEEIQKEVSAFVNSTSNTNAKSLLKKYKTGREIYYSNDPSLTRFNKITHHYEKVGALVKTGYLDFDLYYEVFAFPDEFWDKTKNLRETIKLNWYGDNRQLKDFMSNSIYLQDRFKQRRNSIFTKIITVLKRTSR